MKTFIFLIVLGSHVTYMPGTIYRWALATDKAKQLC